MSAGQITRLWEAKNNYLAISPALIVSIPLLSGISIGFRRLRSKAAIGWEKQRIVLLSVIYFLFSLPPWRHPRVVKSVFYTLLVKRKSVVNCVLCIWKNTCSGLSFSKKSEVKIFLFFLSELLVLLKKSFFFNDHDDQCRDVTWYRFCTGNDLCQWIKS